MSQRPEWKATENTLRAFNGVVVMHGGPEAARIPEHSHPEVEVSVHFRANGGNGMPIARHVHLYSPGQPHTGGWRTGQEVAVFRLSPFLIEAAAEECLLRTRFEIKTFTCMRDRMLEEAGRALLHEFRSSHGLGQLYLESIGNALAGYILRNHAERPLRPVSSRSLNDSDLSRICRYIEEQIETGFTVAELASEIGLGPHEFSRKLRLATGLTVAICQFREAFDRHENAPYFHPHRRHCVQVGLCRSKPLHKCISPDFRDHSKGFPRPSLSERSYTHASTAPQPFNSRSRRRQYCQQGEAPVELKPASVLGTLQ